MARKEKPAPSTEELSEFSLVIIKLILKVPKGKVASYGQIAFIAGRPSAARFVGTVLRKYTREFGLPWQRIIGSQGKIAFPAGTSLFKEQKSMLGKEGVKFISSTTVDYKRYQWKTGAAKKLAQGPRIFR